MTEAAFATTWRRQRIQRRLVLAAVGVAVVVALFVSLECGVVTIGPTATLRALLSPLLPADGRAGATPSGIDVVLNLRLPRALMAVLAGAGLALAGTAMQGITRNVLVSPYTVGISPAAAFGASLSILLGLGTAPGSGPYWTVAAAFLSALACAAIVLALSALRGVTATVLVLSGVGLTYLFGALTATVQFIGTEQQLAAIVHWTFGSLNGSTWNDVGICGAIVVVTALMIGAHAAALDGFAAGSDEVTASLGFAVKRTRLVVTLAAVLMSAGIVSFVGVIGFVGLVAPHIARLLIGGTHRLLLPFSAMVGALLLLVADLIGRMVFAPVTIPVGIVVAYIGVPLFLQLLLNQRSTGPD